MSKFRVVCTYEIEGDFKNATDASFAFADWQQGIDSTRVQVGTVSVEMQEVE